MPQNMMMLTFMMLGTITVISTISIILMNYNNLIMQSISFMYTIIIFLIFLALWWRMGFWTGYYYEYYTFLEMRYYGNFTMVLDQSCMFFMVFICILFMLMSALAWYLMKYKLKIFYLKLVLLEFFSMSLLLMDSTFFFYLLLIVVLSLLFLMILNICGNQLQEMHNTYFFCLLYLLLFMLVITLSVYMFALSAYTIML